jgi:hypothetical protein
MNTTFKLARWLDSRVAIETVDANPIQDTNTQDVQFCCELELSTKTTPSVKIKTKKIGTSMQEAIDSALVEVAKNLGWDPQFKNPNKIEKPHNYTIGE